MGLIYLIIIYIAGIAFLWLWANGYGGGRNNNEPREHTTYGWSKERLPRGVFPTGKPYEYRTRKHAEEGRKNAIEEVERKGYKYTGTNKYGQDQYYKTPRDGYGFDQVEKYTSFIKPNYQEDNHGTTKSK